MEIYPKIMEESEVDKMLEIKLSDLRRKDMLNKQHELQSLLKRYTKIIRKWSIANTVVKSIGLTLVVGAGTAAGVITILPIVLLPIFVVALSGSSVVSTILTESIVLSLTSRKRKHFMKKILLVREYYNRLYIYFENARNDGIIKIEELEVFQAIYQDFYNKHYELKNKQDIEMNYMYKEITKTAIKEVRKEMKDEMLEAEKKNIRQKYGSQLTVA